MQNDDDANAPKCKVLPNLILRIRAKLISALINTAIYSLKLDLK